MDATKGATTVNAQVMQQIDPQDEAYQAPHIKKLLGQRRQAQQDGARYEQEETAATNLFLAAEARRMQNTDFSKIPEYRRAAKEAEERLVDAKEARRVSDGRLKSLSSQIDAAVLAWNQDRKQGLLKEWRRINASFDDQMLALQESRIEKANDCLARLHQLDRSFAPVLAHGAPEFYLSVDCITGKRLPSIEIGSNRAEFRWLELEIGIRN